MTVANQIRRVVTLTTVTAVAGLIVALLIWNPPLSSASPSISGVQRSDWWWVFGALFALSLASELLALQITERGVQSNMDFVPQLGAILLLGPSGAGLIALLSWSIYMFVLERKPALKALFNTSQVVIAVVAAGFVYVLLHDLMSADPASALYGASSLEFTRPFVSTSENVVWGEVLVPFAASSVTYFAINSASVTYIISVSEQYAFREAWQQISPAPILFDLVMSSLAVLVAFLYTWSDGNPFVILLGIVPIIALRYSYGVNLELKQLNSDLLRVLIKTIEAQDPYTSGHSVRVAEGAIAIAKEMRLSPKEVRKIETAALLHDIGKIDASYREILRKDGPLSDDQWKLIREHPEKGVDLVKSVRSLNPDILDYIRHHHERYDGGGYPDGLSGEDIPLGARIIMVSDTIDAMITERPYRDALPPEVIRDELVEHKGAQFDPDVVDAAFAAELLSTGQSPNQVVQELTAEVGASS